MDKKLTSHKGERVKSYEISLKIKVIEYAIEPGNHEALAYMLNYCIVRNWRGEGAPHETNLMWVF